MTLKLHNSMWPGLVGKEEGTDHPPIGLDRMVEMTAAAQVGDAKFDGVDCFLFHPHTDPNATDDGKVNPYVNAFCWQHHEAQAEAIARYDFPCVNVAKGAADVTTIRESD